MPETKMASSIWKLSFLSAAIDVAIVGLSSIGLSEVFNIPRPGLGMVAALVACHCLSAVSRALCRHIDDIEKGD